MLICDDIIFAQLFQLRVNDPFAKRVPLTGATTDPLRRLFLSVPLAAVVRRKVATKGIVVKQTRPKRVAGEGSNFAFPVRLKNQGVRDGWGSKCV